MWKLLGRAKRDTGWFKLKSDIAPNFLLSVVVAVVVYFEERGSEHFRTTDVTVPAIAGVVTLLGYWVVVNGLEFLWNLSQAGNRQIIDELRRAAEEKPSTSYRQEVRDHLVGVWGIAGNFFRDRLSTAQQVKDWVQKLNDWIDETTEYIRVKGEGAGLSAADLVLFRDTTSMPPLTGYAIAFNEAHNRALNRFAAIRGNLKSIIDRLDRQ
jgi:hypothetical protein